MSRSRSWVRSAIVMVGLVAWRVSGGAAARAAAWLGGGAIHRSCGCPATPCRKRCSGRSASSLPGSSIARRAGGRPGTALAAGGRSASACSSARPSSSSCRSPPCCSSWERPPDARDRFAARALAAAALVAGVMLVVAVDRPQLPASWPPDGRRVRRWRDVLDRQPSARHRRRRHGRQRRAQAATTSGCEPSIPGLSEEATRAHLSIARRSAGSPRTRSTGSWLEVS